MAAHGWHIRRHGGSAVAYKSATHFVSQHVIRKKIQVQCYGHVRLAI